MKKSDTIKLSMLGLPAVQSIDDLSELTHISKYTLFQLSKNADKYYRTYTIPKRNGKRRLISQPSKKLKGFQAWILVNILDKLKVSKSCKGFEKGSSIYQNAEPHKSANSLLTVDLKDFFSTVTQKQVFNIFRAVGYNDVMSFIFSNVCTYLGVLPQGSPCSPKLANLATWKLDVRLQGYVGMRGINYTRYADDLSFSGLNPIKVVQLIPMIKKIITEENFFINPDKVRIAGIARAKIVTGLVVSNDTVGIGKKRYRDLRSKIFHLTKPFQQKNQKLLNEVGGWIAYLSSVDTKRANRVRKYIQELATKHPETLVCKLVKQKKANSYSVNSTA